MSRIFLVLLVAGAFVIAPAASADVPDCSCTEVQRCGVTCPGGSGDPFHGPGQDVDYTITLYTDGCAGPLVGFDCYRINYEAVDPDSICVCEELCPDFPYIYPTGPTNASGVGTFNMSRITLLNLENAVEAPQLQVCGCPDIPLWFRSPDVNADCTVGLTDLVIFNSAFVLNPCVAQPTGLQHYTVYTGHCAPCDHPGLSDFVVFSRHLDHTCAAAIPSSCDP